MDRMIYLSMSGAKATMQRQDTLANNLANVDTASFKRRIGVAAPQQGFDSLLDRELDAVSYTERTDRQAGLYCYNGVLIGLVYTYVLFMLFPIYNAISSLDTNQIEAADDLGAPWWKIHWRIVVPHAKPGIASGSVMVFMLSAGSLLVPSILGSTTSQWFTQTIDQWFKDALDWNTASAYAFLLLILCTVFVSIAMKLFRVKLSDIAK